MPERMKPFIPSAVLLLIVGYLGVQALTGERGLLSGAERQELLQQRERQLAALELQRTDLELRVRYLQVDNLSRDLLEERVRVVLGYADPRDYLVKTGGPTLTGPAAASRS